MRQSALARHFGVTQSDVSVALAREGLKPDLWDISHTAQALINLLNFRCEGALAKVDKWTAKANEIAQRASERQRTCSDCAWSMEKKYDEPCCRCVDFSEWSDCEEG